MVRPLKFHTMTSESWKWCVRGVNAMYWCEMALLPCRRKGAQSYPFHKMRFWIPFCYGVSILFINRKLGEIGNYGFRFCEHNIFQVSRICTEENRVSSNPSTCTLSFSVVLLIETVPFPRWSMSFDPEARLTVFDVPFFYDSLTASCFEKIVIGAPCQ